MQGSLKHGHSIVFSFTNIVYFMIIDLGLLFLTLETTFRFFFFTFSNKDKFVVISMLGHNRENGQNMVLGSKSVYNGFSLIPIVYLVKIKTY